MTGWPLAMVISVGIICGTVAALWIANRIIDDIWYWIRKKKE